MFYECRMCGYITNENHVYQNHKCKKEPIIEFFLRCLADINIYPKRILQSNECRKETVVERFLRCLADINIYPRRIRQTC